MDGLEPLRQNIRRECSKLAKEKGEVPREEDVVDTLDRLVVVDPGETQQDIGNSVDDFEQQTGLAVDVDDVALHVSENLMKLV